MGIAYYLLVLGTGYTLSCPFRFLTGYLCPGCGITTMLLALTRGDVQTARAANVFLFYTLPLFLFSVAVHEYFGKERLPLLERLVYPLYVVLLIGFGVYRNVAGI